MTSSLLATSYGHLAEEYYDANAHPTCANFRSLSYRFIRKHIRDVRSDNAILETGAGRSIVAEIFDECRISLGNLMIQDASAAMLEHSAEWFPVIRSHFLSDARSLPLPERSIELVVSSLADPYNDESFMEETARILSPGGQFILTVPSHYWATRFREPNNAEIAEFQMVSGDSHYVPSITRTPERQMKLAREFGLLPREFRAYQLGDIEGPISSKLVTKDDTDVLDAFAFSKPR